MEDVLDRLKKEREKVNLNATEKMHKASNYRMGHIMINGFQISIENPKGSYRCGKDRNGKEWKTLMHHDYGYFTKTVGKDGDAIDVFIGNHFDSDRIFAIDQKVGGKFDETKVMFCFNSEEEAKKAYLSNYQKDWKGFWKITETDLNTFKKWLYDGHKQRKPFFDYVEIKKKKLNEGAWGYGTDDSDQSLDEFADFIEPDKIINKLKKKCKKVPKDGEDAWNNVCLCDLVIDMLMSTNECGYHVDAELVDYILKAIDVCVNDKEWVDGWKEPDEMNKSLTNLRDKYEGMKVEKEKEGKTPEEGKVTEKLTNELKPIVDNLKNSSKLSFMSFYKDDYGTDILMVSGGLNGHGDWGTYFKDILSLYEALNEKFDVWLVDIAVDCLDDVFDLKFGIKVEGGKESLNETKSYNVNMDLALAKSGRTAPKISADEFFEHVKDYFIKNNSSESDYDTEKIQAFIDDPKKKADKKDLMYIIKQNAWKKEKSGNNIFKDLNKIKHDWENCDYIGDIRTTKSGIPYILGDFGGDWEEPILFMVYWDGTEFRGYIPEHGNCYNRDLNQAFGNNEEADEKFIMKNVTNNDGDYSKIHRNLSFNKEECIKDFESRIKVKK